MVRWITAFQSYALAAEAAEARYRTSWAFASVRCALCLQVWRYASAMAHLNVCLEIAAGAAAEKKRYSLAILYDELCRKEWNVKASRGNTHVCTNVPRTSHAVLVHMLQETGTSM